MPKTLGDTLASVLSAYDPQRAVPRLQPRKNEEHWRRQLGNQGTISKPDKTLGDLVSDALVGAGKKAGLSDRTARHLTQRAMGPITDLTPVGNAIGADEGQRTFRQGVSSRDLKQAAIGAGVFGLSMLPFAGSAKRAGRNALMDLMTDESGAIRAWHGSPHDFDRFDMSKIGTGEGAQAYGHGLYFAEKKEVADQYRNILSNRSQAAQDPASAAAFWLGMSNGDRAATAKHFDSIKAQNQRILDRVAKRLPVAPGAAGHALSEIQSADEALAHLANGTEAASGGRLYEVNINAEPEDFLDWDAPLNQQKVAETLGFSARPEDAIHAEAERIMMVHPNGAWMNDPKLRARIDELQAELDRRAPSLSGADFYRQTEPDNYLHTLLSSGNGIASRSQELRQQGIPGLKYLDQGSRGAQQGTRNYVVFDDSLIDILNKF